LLHLHHGGQTASNGLYTEGYMQQAQQPMQTLSVSCFIVGDSPTWQ
jgi:hypothetical protein